MYPAAYHLVHVEPPPYEVEIGADAFQDVSIAVDGTTTTNPPSTLTPSNFQILNIGVFGLGWNYRRATESNGGSEGAPQSESSV